MDLKSLDLKLLISTDFDQVFEVKSFQIINIIWGGEILMTTYESCWEGVIFGSIDYYR